VDVDAGLAITKTAHRLTATSRRAMPRWLRSPRELAEGVVLCCAYPATVGGRVRHAYCDVAMWSIRGRLGPPGRPRPAWR
jgi:hypothetical protein